MTNDPSNIYARIALNHQRSKTRDWIKVQKIDLLDLLREHYAAFIGCPVSEVCAFAEYEDSAVLDFVHRNLGTDIEAYAAHNGPTHPDPYAG